MKNQIKKQLLFINGTKRKFNKINTSLIISTGRTGTNFFEDFFNQNFNSVLAKHEPQPDLFNLGLNYHRNGVSKENLTTEVIYARRDIINQLINGKYQNYVETNPFLSYLSPILNNIFYQPKILHIIRHPDTYIYSAINKDPNNSGNYFMSDTDHRNRINANDFPDNKYYGKWSEMNQFERICWNWVNTNNYIDEHLKDSPNYLRIKFEDLFSDAQENTIDKIINFFELARFQNKTKEELVFELKNKKNYTAKPQYHSFEQLKEENLKFYDKNITKELLKKFGY